MDAFTIIQTSLAILLIVTILLQQKGAGMGGAIGGAGSEAGFSTRRGTEKTVFTASIIIGILFFAFSVTRLLL
ncbi:MAG: preprotein translocase subunit SecG [Parcubacteria group bacterium]